MVHRNKWRTGNSAPNSTTVQDEPAQRELRFTTARSEKSPLNLWRLLVGRPLRTSESAKERINPIEGLSALSLDALTSVAYGPEALLSVLVVGGATALNAMLPITIVIVILLAILVTSYRQVIEAYPTGGGAYAVSKANLGKNISLVAAAALIVDYTLTVAVSIAAGVGALTSAFPQLAPQTVPLCLAFLAILTLMNLRGLGETARVFLLPTALFIIGIYAVIVLGLIHPLALSAKDLTFHITSKTTQALGILLILKAFSAGCSALTGVEAIANGVPLYKEPRVPRAKKTEMLLGLILGSMLIGLAVLANRFHVAPNATQTALSQIMAITMGRNFAFLALSIIITLVLGLAANTSFGGLPILASLLAQDNFLPHRFALKGERQVFSTGIWTLSFFSALLLIGVNGNTNNLIPMFAIGVFTGFTLSQIGLVVHWKRTKPSRWKRKAAINGFGATVTGVSTLIFLLTKFLNGAWLVVIAVPLIILLFLRIKNYYLRVSTSLQLGTIPSKPKSQETTVIIPISQISKLTQYAIGEALSLGQKAIALYVYNTDPTFDESQKLTPTTKDDLAKEWMKWNPGIQLEIIESDYSSIVKPIVDYIDQLRNSIDNQIVVLIPVIIPDKGRYRILHNQTDLLLSAALSKRSDLIVARAKYRLDRTER